MYTVFAKNNNHISFCELERLEKYTDTKMLQKANKALNNQSIYDIMKLPKYKRNAQLPKIMHIYDMSLRQVSRITAVSVAILRNLK